MILTSKNNPLVKETASLKEKKGRKELGLFLVEGVKMSRECQKSGFEIDRIFLSENYEGEGFDEQKTVRVTSDILKSISDEKTPQGVICRVKIPEKTLKKPTGKCLILDGVSDPANMGAIIRTANAAGYKEIYLTPDCTDPYSPKSVRASMSGIFFTKLYFGTREEIIATLEGVEVYVADMGGENVFSITPSEEFALAIGNEGNGISKEIFSCASKTLRIPMHQTQESLNASVAAGICMYLLSKNEFSEN